MERLERTGDNVIEGAPADLTAEAAGRAERQASHAARWPRRSARLSRRP